jgi:hypothetical protein
MQVLVTILRASNMRVEMNLPTIATVASLPPEDNGPEIRKARRGKASHRIS